MPNNVDKENDDKPTTVPTAPTMPKSILNDLSQIIKTDGLKWPTPPLPAVPPVVPSTPAAASSPPVANPIPAPVPSPALPLPAAPVAASPAPTVPTVPTVPTMTTDLYELQFKKDQTEWEQTIKHISFEFPLLSSENNLSWKQRLNRNHHFQKIEMQFWAMVHRIHKQPTQYNLKTIVFVPRQELTESWTYTIRHPIRKESVTINREMFQNSKIHTLSEKAIRDEFDFLGVQHKDDRWLLVKQFLHFILPRLQCIKFYMNMKSVKQLGASQTQLTKEWQEEIVGSLPDHRHDLVFGGTDHPFLQIHDAKAGTVFFSLYVDPFKL
jgi:hypothetical protein